MLLASAGLPPFAVNAEDAQALVVDADTVQYDETGGLVEATGNVRLSYRGIRLTAHFVQLNLTTEVLAAEGRVVLVDAQGRELRGERVTYDLRAERAEVWAAEVLVDGVHIRSQRIERLPDRILASESSFTTCDPDRPCFKITAASVEVYPGDRIVARQASIWLGSWRVITLPAYTVSLRNPEETARSFPRLGYNDGFGFWLDYRFFFRFGGTGGSYTQVILGTRTSGLGLNLKLWEAQIGTLPLISTLSVGAGWFYQVTPLLDSTRLYYRAGITTPPISLGPATTWETNASWDEAAYGTGGRQNVARATSAVTHRLGEFSSLRLGYDRLEVFGATPFAFDTVDPDDIAHTISLQFTQNTPRSAEISSTVTLGTSYNFLDQTPSMNVGYGERSLSRYHWGLGTEYNLTTRVTKLSPDIGMSAGSDTYLTIQAVYNTNTALFEDLDYLLTARICGCLDVSVKYRQVRQEIWFEVGLAAFPGARVGVQPNP